MANRKKRIGSDPFNWVGDSRSEADERVADDKTEGTNERPTERTTERSSKRGNKGDELGVVTSLRERLESESREVRRPTKRYSFEAYVDQIEAIDEIRFLYKKQTGEDLTISELLRDHVIDDRIKGIREWLKEREGASKDV